MKKPTLIAQDVKEARDRILALDPHAYSGFVTDAACEAVAERRGIQATDAVRCYRAFYPAKGRISPPRGARRPSEEAVAAA
jgi:hypothetical protein